MSNTNRFVNLNDLSQSQVEQYEEAILQAFPKTILASPVTAKYWNKLLDYYPQYQLFLISSEGEVIGFINTIPFAFDEALHKLPDTGWDWMFEKGITGHNSNQTPNYLGGLQVIIKKAYQGQGHSKHILNQAKNVAHEANFKNLLIPIRPTGKHEFPEMSMLDYIKLKTNNQVHDPWIRTHLKHGAEIINVCHKSMTINGNIQFWEAILDQKIKTSGEYKGDRLLNPIRIDIEHKFGEYIEPNIWIRHII